MLLKTNNKIEQLENGDIVLIKREEQEEPAKAIGRFIKEKLKGW